MLIICWVVAAFFVTWALHCGLNNIRQYRCDVEHLRALFSEGCEVRDHHGNVYVVHYLDACGFVFLYSSQRSRERFLDLMTPASTFRTELLKYWARPLQT